MSDTTGNLQRAIGRYNAGDESAREELISLLVGRLEIACRRLLRRDRLRFHLRTDDLLQESLVSLHQALRTIRVDTAQELLRLGGTHIRRRAWDFARRLFGPLGSAQHEVNASDLPDSGQGLDRRSDRTGDDPYQSALAVERTFLVHQEIERLPDELREVVELCWFERLSPREAAEILGLCDKTVRKRLLIAQGRLGRLLRELGLDGE